MDTHCPGCLSSVWGGEWGFTAGSPRGSSLPVLLSSTGTAHGQNGPTMPKARSVGSSLNTLHPANPGMHSATPGLLISPLPLNGLPKLGTVPSHQFHQGLTTATREVAPPHSSSICSAAGSTTKTQTATPPLTSGGEVAAGCGFVLPPSLLPGTVSTSWDDSKPGRRSLRRCLF